MSINRFDRFLQNDYGFQVYEPQEYTPDLNALDNLMQGLQKEYSVSQSAIDKYMSPNYIRESESDRLAAQEFRNRYKQKRDEIAKIFAEGNIRDGRRALNQAVRDLQVDTQPGGEYYELERRAKEFSDKDAALRKQYMEEIGSPELYRLARRRLVKQGLSPFKNEDTGEYGTIGDPQMYKHVSQKEALDYFDKIADNIEADQIIKGGYSTRDIQGMSFKELLERGELEYIDFDKAANILAKSVTPEMALAFEQYGEAQGLGKGQGRLLATEEEREQYGTPFAPTALGQLVDAVAGSKVYQKYKDKSKVLTNTYGEGKALQDYEFQLSNPTLRTTVYTQVPGMPEFDIKVTKDGKIITKQNKVVEAGLGLPAFIYQQKTARQELPFKEYIQTPEFAEEYPGMVELADRFAPELEDMSDKEAHEFLENQYNIKRDKLSVADAKYQVFDAKRAKNYTETFIGENGRIGNIQNQTVIVREEGRAPQPMSYTNFIKTYNLNQEDFIERTKIHGKLSSTNPSVPSGFNAVYSHPKNPKRNLQITITPESLEKSNYNQPIRTLRMAKTDDTILQSPPTYTGIEEIDYAQENGQLVPRQIYARRQDVFVKDQLKEQLAAIENSILQNPNLSDEIIQQYEEQAEQLEEQINNLSPEDNVFVRRDIILHDARNNEPLVDENNNPITIDFLADIKQAMLENNE